MDKLAKKLPKLPVFPLPSILPDKRSLNSSTHNDVHYDPEFWELEYSIDRYLENISDKLLIQRYKDIARNFSRLVCEDRHSISINSFLSSWYWFRKEHHTRLEFHSRKFPLPSVKFDFLSPDKYRQLPFLPNRSNSGDMLFRFGSSKYMKPLIEKGEIRIGAASQYKDGLTSDPRTDDELNKHSFIPSNSCIITTESGEQISIIGDVQRSISCENYFVLCFARGYHPDLFTDFSADCCVIIHNVEEFAKRIDSAFRNKLGEDWIFGYLPIEYFDPYELDRNALFNTVMSKDFSYAYQMEYRFAWISQQKMPANGYHYLELGSVEDIASLYYPTE
jgi:hypothetical protein